MTSLLIQLLLISPTTQKKPWQYLDIVSQYHPVCPLGALRGFNMKIGIIGGSIAGLTSAILLSRQGAQVTILERSKESLESRGAGIALSETVVKQCIDLDLFDTTIPSIGANGRSFVTQGGQKIWEQPIATMGLNWSDIYRNLSKRASTHLKKGERVLFIEREGKGYEVTTETGSVYTFDHLIGADGIDSCVRKILYPKLEPEYCGYIAWRGTVLLSQVMATELFKNHIPYFVYPHGHILLYAIPAKDYAQNGNVLLNWIMYDTCKSWTFDTLLTDAQGKRHANALPPGSLGKNHSLYLKTFAHQVLPSAIADIICQTQEPFLQVIYDCKAPSVMKENAYLIGDAAAVLRPHVAAGVIKALTDSISLANAFAKNELPLWQQQQDQALVQQTALAKRMGEGLVTKTPHWDIMTQEGMKDWWAAIVAGTTWHHHTPATQAKPVAFQYEHKSQIESAAVLALPPEDLKKVSKL
jgi:2-polyprenyl-6-methoxyphenol hydroxylase-like FAD-dependent oxidoreductase